MYSKFLLVSTLLMVGLLTAKSAPFFVPQNAHELIPNQYIIQLNHEKASSEDLTAHIANLTQNFHSSEFAVQHQWVGMEQFGFLGYSASLSDHLRDQLLQDDLVLLIEQDQVMHTNQQACTVQNGATWGIDRVTTELPVLDNRYYYTAHQDSSVDSYIIDTGIYTSNNDFEGRATQEVNYVNDGRNTDCNGHGTHVAGTVGGKVYGIAKKTNLIGVKVLGCNGSGSNSGVISGVNYAGNGKGKRRTANMSLGGGLSSALNNAVDAAVRSGVVFAVAAGNDNADACRYSPASASLPISVGATDLSSSSTGKQEDIRSTFSNYGKCVDAFAPGTLITSAWIGSPSATLTISGTSMASPHVAGVAAILWENEPTATADQITARILAGTTKELINLNCRNTQCRSSPNALLYKPCE